MRSSRIGDPYNRTIPTSPGVRRSPPVACPPDVGHQSSKRETVDRALRELIELAVLELSQRRKDWDED